MRYIFFAVLLLSACTRANPDAIGGNGGSGGGGTAGSGGGGGGSAGGGGTGGGHDLAVATPDDMAKSPADMTSFVGVFCGTMTCVAPDNECCAMSSSLACQSPLQPCNGAPYDCDGPEDCMKGLVCCGGGTGSTCDQLTVCEQENRVPLCHTLDDCPKTNGGFTACCPSPQGGHLHFCSNNPC